MRRYTLFYILFILLISCLHGAEETPLSLQEELSSGNDKFYQEFVKMLTILGAMVATLIIVAWLFRKVTNTRMDQMNVTSVMKILERRVISPKSVLYLIEVHNHRIVVGESHNGLVMLADIPMSGAAAQQTSFEEVMENIQIKNEGL